MGASEYCFSEDPPDEFENEREDAFEDCREIKCDVKKRAAMRAKKIAGKRQFAIDQQNAKQDDIFGDDDVDTDAVLDDLLEFRRACSEPTFPDESYVVDYAGPVFLDNGDFYKDDIPF